VAKRKRTK